MRRKFEYIFIILILLGGLLVRLYKIDNPVADWHSWRQADTASVSRIFLSQGIDILRPRYHDISSIQTGYFNPEGWRMLEVPLYNAAHVVLFRSFGAFSFDTWGRLTTVLASLGTTFFVFLLGRKISGSVAGLFSAFFYAFIPFNVYFTRVILPDPMAVFFAVAGVYYFLRYIENESLFSLYFSALLLGVGIMVKPQAVFYGLPIVYLAIRKYGLRGIFKKKTLLLALDVALIPFFVWRIWIGQVPYLRGIAHFAWAFNGDGIRFRPAFWRWIYGERIGSMILGVWGVVPFVFGVIGKGEKEKFRGYLVWLLLGMAAYMGILATANVRHDYYQVHIIPAMSLALGIGIVQMIKAKEYNFLLRIGLLAFSIFMMFIIGIDKTKGFYQINNPVIIEAGNALDAIAPTDALVIAPYNGDTAFLYQTKRSGWPVVDDSIEKMIERGADYFVSVNNDSDTARLKSEYEAEIDNGRYVIINLHKEKQNGD